ncbi:MAG: hypothetical protein ACKVQJ_04775 [Pyrinomonadaceae bacterium]
MRSRVYIETSVVSFYHEARTEADMVARRDRTRKFWILPTRNTLYSRVPP